MELPEFEKRLKQASKNTVPFDAEFHWESLSHQLDGVLPVSTGRRRIIPFWWIFGSIAIIVGASLIWMFSFSGQTYTEITNVSEDPIGASIPIVGDKIPMASAPIAVHEPVATSHVGTSTNSHSASWIDNGSNNVVEATRSNSKDPNMQHASSLIFNTNAARKTLGETDPRVLLVKNRNEEEQKISDLGESIDKLELTERKQPTVASIPTPLEPLATKVLDVEATKGYTKSPFAKKVRKKKQLGLLFLGGMSKPMGDYSASSADLAELAELHNSAFDALEAFNVQALVEYPIGEHFRAAVGLDYSRINQLFEQEFQTEITRTLENVVVGIRINTVTGDTTFITDDVQQTGTSFQTIRHYNSLISLSVPLQFQYHTSLHTFGLGFTVGTLFTINQRQKGKFLDINGQLNENSVINIMGIKQFFVAPSVSHALSNNLELEFRPFAQFYLDNLSSISGITYKPIQVGGQVGLRYVFQH